MALSFLQIANIIVHDLNQTDKNHKQFIEEVLNNKISKEYTLEKEKPCRWHLKEVKRNVLIENWDNGEESAKIIISLYNIAYLSN